MGKAKCPHCGHINPSIGGELTGMLKLNINETVICNNCGEYYRIKFSDVDTVES